MDKNTWIGFLLIAAIIVGFSLVSRPSKEEMAERQRVRDSIAFVEYQAQEAQMIAKELQQATAVNDSKSDSIALREQVSSLYGPLASSAKGMDAMVLMENACMRLWIAQRGGRIAKVELKNYKAYNDTVNPLCLFDTDESRLNFTLVTSNNRILGTENLYFKPLPMQRDSNSTTLTMRLMTEVEGSYMDVVYQLYDDDYMLRMTIEPHAMQYVLAHNLSSLEMQWDQKVPQHEQGYKYECKYSQLQYMFAGGDMERMSDQKHALKQEASRIRWIGYKDQFFSSVLIADDAFVTSTIESTPMDAYSGYVKDYKTTTSVPFDATGKKVTGFRMYLGPNHYNTLKAYDEGKDKAEWLHLKELVPLGWKIVSWINMILVIPMFDLFTSWGLHIGIVILLMTLVIKIIILPFVFASYKSSAKMRVLKPQMDAINEKYPADKMQERQKATMELYHKAGVSPMSGCLPMLFQFPVLMAMFWFLPNAIELRGQSLFWASDLSTYDALITWSRPIPLFGTHLSLFCLLMSAMNFAYTYLTMQTQSGGQEMKMMKWMMYMMPVMFLFIFNDYAAGLSYYYMISLLFTVLQTMIFRWAIDDKKVLAQMEANARKKGDKPKKSGFMARLEKMQQEQQRMARENAKAQQKRMR